jgi:hypothetical protein
MTYPHPSEHYQELVCVAGVTERGQWVRIYPVDYRYMDQDKRFQKYQWIEVGLFPYGHRTDTRKESRRPNLDTLKKLGEPLSTKDAWKERREIVDALRHCTVNQLKSLYEKERTSLGIVRPKQILDLKVSSTDRVWKPTWRNLFFQKRLFGKQKPLCKIPYQFQYSFECEDSEKPHQAMIEDWELGVLFLKEKERLRSEEAAAQSIRRKYFDEMCRDDKDTRFFMGTRFPYNTWLVIGVFWPPKIPAEPLTLFDL